MAVSPVIPNTVEVRLLSTVAGQGAINVLHGLKTGSVTVNQALANTLGAAIKAAFTSNLAPLMSSSNALFRVGVRDLSTANQSEFLDNGAAAAGTSALDTLPPQTAACVTLRTALSGKSFRGRVYLSGFDEAQNATLGTMQTATSNACVSFMNAVASAMTASSMTLGVSSRPAERTTVVKTTFHNDGSTTVKTLSSTTAKPGGTQAVTSIASRNNAWESQRRRANGRGAPPTALQNVAEVHL